MHLTRGALSALIVLAALAPVTVSAASHTDAAFAKTPVDPPFWTGAPSAAQFTKLNADRISKAKSEIAKLKSAKGARTIANTLVPYDEAGRWLDMAGSQSSLIENVHPDSGVRAAAEKISQDVSAYATEISLDRDVYQALAALPLTGLDNETTYYIQKELRDFKLAGVDKDEATRKKIRALREELVKVGQEFDRNIRGDVRTVQVKAADLAGLPKDFLDSHKPDAAGMVTLNTTYPDYVPTMSYAVNDDLRKRLFIEYQNRAYPKNMDVLKKMMDLRNQIAIASGFTNWADYITANKMVGSAKNVRDFIDKIVAASGPAQTRDYQQLLNRKKKDFPAATEVTFWENNYWSELVKRSDYNFDSQSIRPYLPYEKVEAGILEVASTLFGVTFKQVPNAPVWHPSVKCFELLQGSTVAGRIYLDMHPRPNKYNHAAQFDVRTGVAGKQIPEAALVCNLPGGEPGDPGLCEIDDVNTFFHEFGHLMHSQLAGHRKWLGTSGIRTEHDFVEAPSQMLEEWMLDAKTLQTFAKHYQTGEVVPTEMVSRMRRADDFAKGLQVRRQMVYADLSLSIYDRDPSKVDVDAMMKDMVTRYQPYKYVDETHFACSFGHLDGYSAVYYTYMWSLVIAKDMFSAFNKENLLDPTVSMRYRKAVLEAGGSEPAAKMVEAFLGRPFNFNAYQAWLNQAN